MKPQNHPMDDLDDVQKHLAVGYRFTPTDREIIIHYLINKILNQPLPSDAIKDIDFYAVDPDQLPISNFEGYCGPNKAYFFTQVLRGRTAKSGQWKAFGEEEPVLYKDEIIVGFKRRFVFYSGTNKTNWIVKEYRANPGLIPANSPNEVLKSKIDSVVVCKIHYKKPEDSTN